MYKYNPKRIVASLQNIPFEGLMDGVFFTIEMVNKRIMNHEGGSGELSVALNTSRLGKATATFVQGSPTNDALSKIIPDAFKNYFPTGPFKLQDLNGNSLVNSKDAFLEDYAKMDFGKDITGRPWVIYLPEVEIFVGGTSQ